MFKRLKEKITEDVMQSPMRLTTSVQRLGQQYSPFKDNGTKKTEDEQQQQSASTSHQSDVTGQNLIDLQESSSSLLHSSAGSQPQQFSISEDDGALSTPTSPTPQAANFETVDLLEAAVSVAPPSSRPRTSSVSSSSGSSVSQQPFFPVYSPVQPTYNIQSDLESASEVEDGGGGVNLDQVSKEQLLSALHKTRVRYVRCKARYAEAVKAYREQLSEKEKVKAILTESQDKALRRISELREQAQLDRKAKAHLEENFTVTLEEKQELINVLQTQVRLLKGNADPVAATTGNEQESVPHAVSHTDAATAAAAEDDNLRAKVLVYEETIAKLKNLLKNCKETITRNKETASKLALDKEQLERRLSESAQSAQAELAQVRHALSESAERVAQLSAGGEKLEAMLAQKVAKLLELEAESTRVGSELATLGHSLQEESQQQETDTDTGASVEPEWRQRVSGLATALVDVRGVVSSTSDQMLRLKTECAADLRSCETGILAMLERRCSEWENERKQLCSERDERVELLAQCEARIVQLEARLTSADEELKASRLDNTRLSQQMVNVAGSEASLRDQLSELRVLVAVEGGDADGDLKNELLIQLQVRKGAEQKLVERESLWQSEKVAWEERTNGLRAELESLQSSNRDARDELEHMAATKLAEGENRLIELRLRNEELQSSLASLQSEFELLENGHRESCERMRSDSAAELAEVVSKHENELANLAQQNEDLTMKYAALRSEFQKLEESHLEARDKIERDAAVKLAEAIQVHEQEQLSGRQQKDELETKLDSLQSALESLERTHRNNCERIERDNESKLADSIEKHENELANLVRQNQDLATKLTTLQAEFEILQQSHLEACDRFERDSAAKLAETLRAHERDQINTVERKEELEAKLASLQSVLDSLETTHRNSCERIEREHASKVAKIIEKHEIELANLAQQTQDAVSELSALQSEFDTLESSHLQFKRDSAAELAESARNHEHERTNLMQRNDEAEQKLATLRAELESTESGYREKCEQLEQDLATRLARAVEVHELERTNVTRHNQELDANLISLRAELESLESGWQEKHARLEVDGAAQLAQAVEKHELERTNATRHNQELESKLASMRSVLEALETTHGNICEQIKRDAETELADVVAKHENDRANWMQRNQDLEAKVAAIQHQFESLQKSQTEALDGLERQSATKLAEAVQNREQELANLTRQKKEVEQKLESLESNHRHTCQQLEESTATKLELELAQHKRLESLSSEHHLQVVELQAQLADSRDQQENQKVSHHKQLNELSNRTRRTLVLLRDELTRMRGTVLDERVALLTATEQFAAEWRHISSALVTPPVEPELEGELIALRSSLERSQEQCGQLESRALEVDQLLGAAQAEVRECTATRDQLSAELDAVRLQHEATVEQLEHSRQEVCHKQASVEAVELRLTELMDENRKLEKASTDGTRELTHKFKSKLKAVHAQHAAEVKRVSERVGQLEREKDELQTRLDELSAESAAAQSEMRRSGDQLMAECAREGQQHSDRVHSALDVLIERLAGCERRVDDVRTQKKQDMAAEGKWQADAIGLRQQLLALSEERDAALERLAQLESLLATARADRDQLSNDKVRLSAEVVLKNQQIDESLISAQANHLEMLHRLNGLRDEHERAAIEWRQREEQLVAAATAQATTAAPPTPPLPPDGANGNGDCGDERLDRSQDELATANIKRLASEFSLMMATREEEGRQALANAIDDGVSETSRLRREHAKQLQELSLEMGEKEVHAERLLDAKDNQIQELSERLSASVATHEETLARLRAEHRNRVEELERKWKTLSSQQLKRVEAAHDEEVAALAQEWQQERKFCSEDQFNSVAQIDIVQEDLQQQAQLASSVLESGGQSSQLLRRQIVQMKTQMEAIKERHGAEVKELHYLLASNNRTSTSSPSSLPNDNIGQSVEIEYLKNILFEYMMGKETLTLAKVIAAVVRFSEDQTKRVLEREENRLNGAGVGGQLVHFLK